ncbi:MAG: PKD domain-containing protein [Candidatus Paceibacterota bacterium]
MKKYIGALVIVLSFAVSLPALAMTQPEIQSKIQELIQKVQALQAQLGTSNSVSNVAAPRVALPSETFCFNFNKNLTIGDGTTGTDGKDADVLALQTVLEKEGFSIDDSEQKGGAQFGESTAAAVVQFQGKYGIIQTGYVGPLTRAKLNAVYGCTVTPINPSIKTYKANDFSFQYDGSATVELKTDESGVGVYYGVYKTGGVFESIRLIHGSVTSYHCDKPNTVVLKEKKFLYCKSTGEPATTYWYGKGDKTLIIDVQGSNGKPYSYIIPESVEINSVTSSVSSITVTSPNGETYKAGDSITVKWRSNNISSRENVSVEIVKVYSSHDAGPWITLAESTPNDGIQTFTLNPDRMSLGEYKLAVRRVIDKYHDRADGSFTITSSTTTPMIKATDSDNSPSYYSYKSFSPNLKDNPDLFIAGVGKGDYVGGGACLYGTEPNPISCKPTNDSFTTYYDHCAGDNQLNEAFVTSDGKLGALGISPPFGYKCLNGKFVSSTTNYPVISGVSGPQSLTTNQQGTWNVNAYNLEGGNLSYSVDWGDAYRKTCLSGAPCAAVSAMSQQSATFTHVYTYGGTYTITFTVTNDAGQSAKTSLSVKVGEGASINKDPSIQGVYVNGVFINNSSPLVVDTNQIVTFNFSATDPDNDDIAWSYNWGDFNAGGMACPVENPQRKQGWTYSTNHTWNTAGTYLVKVGASDCRGGSAETSFTVTVIGSTVVTPDRTCSGTQQTISEGPLGNPGGMGPFEKLGMDTSSHPEILKYRIQWFNGGWSDWYVPGVGDQDSKNNIDGTPRRMWSYFDDHTHEYVRCNSFTIPLTPVIPSIPTATSQIQASMFDITQNSYINGLLRKYGLVQ